MRKLTLTREEKMIEARMDEYVSVKKDDLKVIAASIAARRKDAVLNIRVNRFDLENIRAKSRKLGVGYQTFISEILHKIAQA
jgi:predicted DNA binding CopG/RHH family protein